MALRTLSVMVVSGDPEYNRWCEACRAPSAVRVPLILMGKGGVVEINSVTLCLTCDGEVFGVV